MITIGEMAVLGVLLVLEWWRRSRILRGVLVLIALAVLEFEQPMPYRAMRHAFALPRAAQDTTFGPNGRPLSEYEAGVFTRMHVAIADAQIDANGRAVALGVQSRWPCSRAGRSDVAGDLAGVSSARAASPCGATDRDLRFAVAAPVA